MNAYPKRPPRTVFVFSSAPLFREERYADTVRTWTLSRMLRDLGLRVVLFGPDCHGFEMDYATNALAKEELISAGRATRTGVQFLGPATAIRVLFWALRFGRRSEADNGAIVLYNGGWMAIAAKAFAALRPRTVLHLDLMGIAHKEARLARYRFWKAKAWAFELALGLAVSGSRIITTINVPHAQAISRQYGRRAFVLPDRIDRTRLEELTSLPIPRARGNTTIFYMGSLSRRRLDLFLQVCHDLTKEMPDLRVVISGSGLDLARYVREFGSDQIQFTGYVEDQTLLANLADADICYSDVWHGIGTPYKIIEYMAAARAIVTHRSPSVEELIEGGVDGIICEAQKQGLESALRSLIRDKDLRLRLGRRAREKAVALHAVDWRARLCDLYRDRLG